LEYILLLIFLLQSYASSLELMAFMFENSFLCWPFTGVQFWFWTPNPVEVVEHACGMGTLQMGEYVSNVSNGIDTFSIREPLGVCAGICPFNFPAMIPLWVCLTLPFLTFFFLSTTVIHFAFFSSTY
jgi:hypothetical protein